jgi:Asp-tRNA(Asn)/Glu-tRNA(Gln) amidotransferase A subunit family amidase
VTVSWLDDGHLSGIAFKPSDVHDPLTQLEERFAEREPKVQAFLPEKGRFARLHRDAEAALSAIPNSLYRGNLFGIPIGVKDIFHVDGFPTRAGSRLPAEELAGTEASVITRLRKEGALILGKTVSTEFAYFAPGPTRNPHHPEHTPGGSSSGSAAAVAAGMISAGLGTQVIGSTIRPASFCGCVGFKPTVSALNREGSHDYQSQSCTGILAATLPDAWQVACEIAQRVGGDAGTPGLMGPERAPEPVKPRRLAFLETSGWAVASDAAKASMQEALRRLSTAGVEIRTSADDADVSAIETELAEAFTLSNRINSFETRWFIDGCAERDASLLSQSMRDRLEQARVMTLADYRGWLKERTSMRALYAELADTCDACVTLSAPAPAPKGLQTTGNPQFAVPSSLLGIPALSLPLFMLDSMPLGLQVLGYANGDADAFAIGAWLMKELGGETGREA